MNDSDADYWPEITRAEERAEQQAESFGDLSNWYSHCRGQILALHDDYQRIDVDTSQRGDTRTVTVRLYPKSREEAFKIDHDWWDNFSMSEDHVDSAANPHDDSEIVVTLSSQFEV